MGTALKMKCLSFCAVMLMLVIALVIGAADEPHDLSSLDQRASVEAASPTDDLESLSKEQLLSFFTGQVADLKKQSANQNAAHDEQVADLKITAGRKVTCVSFSHISAAKSVLACGRYGTGRVCTKPAFLHPHGASKHVVGIMLKRLVCSGTPEKCFTHKMGYCISNQKSGQLSYFSSSLTFKIKPEEYAPAQKMLKGKWTDIFDTKNGGIKAEWACGAEDTKIFKDTIMAF